MCVVQMYSMYRGSSGTAVCVWCRCTEEVQVQQCVCGADVQRKFRYSSVCIVQMFSMYRGSSDTAVCVECRCTVCTEEVQVQQCVCGADVQYVQRKFRYSSVCVVQMYGMYRGSSGTAVCVWCRCTVCTEEIQVQRYVFVSDVQV